MEDVDGAIDEFDCTDTINEEKLEKVVDNKAAPSAASSSAADPATASS